MKYRLLDILACPECKGWPLKLLIFETKQYEYKILPEETPYCRDYCGLHGRMIKEIDAEKLDCRSCVKTEIVSGMLICPKCGRWYPIMEEIPIMLPDEYRFRDDERERERSFLERWREKVPKEILDSGKPFGLKV